MPRVVGYFRVRSLFYQEQGGVCTPVVKQTDQRGTAIAVRCINVRSVLYQFPDYLLVPAPGSGVQGCFRQVVGDGRIRLAVKQQVHDVPVTFQTSVMQRRIALGVPLVHVDAAFLQEYLHDAFLSVPAGIQKSHIVVHTVSCILVKT